MHAELNEVEGGSFTAVKDFSQLTRGGAHGSSLTTEHMQLTAERG